MSSSRLRFASLLVLGLGFGLGAACVRDSGPPPPPPALPNEGVPPPGVAPAAEGPPKESPSPPEATAPEAKSAARAGDPPPGKPTADKTELRKATAAERPAPAKPVAAANPPAKPGAADPKAKPATADPKAKPATAEKAAPAKPASGDKAAPTKPTAADKAAPAQQAGGDDTPATPAAKAAGPAAKPDAGAASSTAAATTKTAARPDAGVALAMNKRPGGRGKGDSPLVLAAEPIADGGAPGVDYANVPKKTAGGKTAPAPPPLPPPPTASIPGGPLPIAGSKVDFDPKRVERFMEEGGTALVGQVMDADAGKPVDGAQVEAWMGTKSIHYETESDGRFRFEGLVPGSKITLWITATAKYVQERIEVAVPASGPQFDARFKLLPRAAATGRSGGIGVFLSRRGGKTVVTGLDAFGPAERAGLAVGDVILSVGKRDVGELGPGAVEYLLRGTIGDEVEVTVAHAGTAPRTLTLRRASR